VKARHFEHGRVASAEITDIAEIQYFHSFFCCPSSISYLFYYKSGFALVLKRAEKSLAGKKGSHT
jgi:hypothetical protein